MLPSLFISHGAPSLPFEDVPARDFLRGLGERLGERPKAILAVSAHWETAIPTVNAPLVNETIHDFGGFARELYGLTYPAPTAPALAERVEELSAASALACEVDHRRGLDHGAWVPLMLMYPEADIPVAQLSIQSHLKPGHHPKLGRALAPLRNEGVLIMASGSFTHDLSGFQPQGSTVPEPEPDWVGSFAHWMDKALLEGRTCDLVGYRSQAPHAARNHPTDEHLLPLFVAMGAGGGKAERLHASVTHEVIRMDAYAFATSAK